MRVIDKSRWPLLSPLLDELLDLPDDQRPARLQALRGDDADLADDLQELLQREQGFERSAFLAQPVLADAPAGAGQTVGPYTLERELGQGGMGVVWLARRTDGRYEGQVAIKFLSRGLFGQGEADRFAREGQILARLAHPNIARLIDAGVLPGGGAPYLVLEYIDGLPITRYCAEQGLEPRQLALLFLGVLAAVAHAHTRLILHRDLKPSNILVNRAGEVKLLDFGVAKLLSDVGQDGLGDPEADLTQRLGRAFTPQFAAPEQVGGGEEVTTATDVYALGVLLYLLLSGRHPTSAELAPTQDTLIERMRALVETEPRRLSEQVRAQGGTAAARRAREVRGDLDTIVGRALKKAPAERYPNAAAMADDLRHWLAHEPIRARPDSAGYLLGKFIRRHRIGVAAGSLAAAGLLAGIGVALWQAREARHQRSEAEGLIEFMLGDLRQKLEPVGRLDVLDAVGQKALGYYAGQQIDGLDPDSLGRRARALHLMGEMAELRGKLEDADRFYRSAGASTGELLARYPRDAQRIFDHAQSVYWIGSVARRQGRSPEAEAQWARYLGLADELVGLDPDKLDWRIEQASAGMNLGVLQLESGQSAQAAQTLQDSRDVWQGIAASHPASNNELAQALGWLARAQEYKDDIVAAVATEEAVIGALGRVPDGQTDRHTQHMLANARFALAQLNLYRGRLDTARAAARDAVAQFDALVALDASNLQWLADGLVARTLLADIDTSMQLPRPGPEFSAAMDGDLARLLKGHAANTQWQITVRGGWLLLKARWAAGSVQPGLAQELAAFLDDMARFAAAGQRPSEVQTRIAALIGLRLGDMRLASGRAEAEVLWRAAGQRLQSLVAQGSLPAMTVQALLEARFGHIDASRAMADKIEASAYRHPLYAELREFLKDSARP